VFDRTLYLLCRYVTLD